MALVVALVAAPLVVAVLLAIVILSARSSPDQDNGDTLPKPADVTTPLPGVPEGDYTAFCAEAEALGEAVTASLGGELATSSPAAVADAIEQSDLASFDVEGSPEGLRPALQVMIDNREALVAAFRALPEGAEASEVTLDQEVVTAIGTFVQAYDAKCA